MKAHDALNAVGHGKFDRYVGKRTLVSFGKGDPKYVWEIWDRKTNTVVPDDQDIDPTETLTRPLFDVTEDIQ